MTLIIGTFSKHGIVLVGDKRTYNPTTTTYDDNAIKVFKLNDKVALGGAGNGFDCKAIIDDMVANPKLKEMDIEEATNLLLTTARAKQAELINASPDNPLLIALGRVIKPEFGFIILGFNDKQEPKMYCLTDNSIVSRPITENYLPMGIVDISKYIFSKEYSENMTIKQLGELAIRCIKETNKISLAVSNICDVIKIKLLPSA